MDTIMFPQLGRKTVDVGGADGMIYQCRVLPLSAGDEITAIVNDVAVGVNSIDVSEQDAAQKEAGIIAAGCERLRALICPNVPEEIRGDIARMSYHELVALAHVLFYANVPQDKNVPKKKLVTMK